MLPEAILFKIKEIISKVQKICLVLHARPDADTIGASLAMNQYLVGQGKKTLLFCPTEIPRIFHSWLYSENIVTQTQAVLAFAPDLVITLDASDKQVSGLEVLLPQFDFKPFIVNIDHHQTNTLYGDFNLVVKKAASTTQVLFYLFQGLKAEITPRMAEGLLLGLLNDTQSFSNPATTPQSLWIGEKLLYYGANINKLQKQLFKNKSIAFLKFLGKVFQNIFVNSRLGIICAIFMEEEMKKNTLSLSFEEMNGVTNIFNYLNEGQIILVLKEKENGLIHCSMRTTKENINLGYLAKILGGGGHSKAAGFAIHGKIAKINSGYQIL
jgi:phosphoesterase RecJ-like protein